MRSVFVSVSHGIFDKCANFGVHFPNSLIAEGRGRAQLSFWNIFILSSKVIKVIARSSSITDIYNSLFMSIK